MHFYHRVCLLNFQDYDKETSIDVDLHEESWRMEFDLWRANWCFEMEVDIVSVFDQDHYPQISLEELSLTLADVSWYYPCLTGPIGNISAITYAYKLDRQ